MNEFIKKFKKAGGWKLIKQYSDSGVLLFAVTEFLKLGTSQTSLELVRAGVQLKIQKKLYKNYSYVLNNIDKDEIVNMPNIKGESVWVCWLQGVENAPLIVQKCIESIKRNFIDYEVVIITENNYKDYVEFPKYIQEKIDSGLISKTHFSDLLRLELLIKRGGIWIDSTVLITDEKIPTQIKEASLFMFQELKPSRDGHCLPISTWFMVAKSNNLILWATQAMLYEYWKKNNKMIDYFLIHHFINISKVYYSEVWEKMPKYSNCVPHMLLLELFDNYSVERYEEIMRLTNIHKLSYKFSEEQINKLGTYYKYLFN